MPEPISARYRLAGYIPKFHSLGAAVAVLQRSRLTELLSFSSSRSHSFKNSVPERPKTFLVSGQYVHKRKEIKE